MLEPTYISPINLTEIKSFISDSKYGFIYLVSVDESIEYRISNAKKAGKDITLFAAQIKPYTSDYADKYDWINLNDYSDYNFVIYKR